MSATEARKRRHKRIRKKVKGTRERPRLSVFRSNRHIYAQIITDGESRTLVSASDLELEEKKGKTKTEVARMVGKLLAQKAEKEKIEKVVFDRGGYTYHGRVKALAEGARKEGLSF